MKKFLTSLFVLVLLFSTGCFADNVTCPSIAKIRETQFNDRSVIPYGEYPYHEWLAHSEILNDQSVEWRVSVYFVTPSDSSQNALKYLQDKIKTALLGFPIHQKDKWGLTVCTYSLLKTFHVVAYNPPDPGLMRNFH